MLCPQHPSAHMEKGRLDRRYWVGWVVVAGVVVVVASIRFNRFIPSRRISKKKDRIWKRCRRGSDGGNREEIDARSFSRAELFPFGPYGTTCSYWT